MEQPTETRRDALDRALKYHADNQMVVGAEGIVATSKTFEAYLNGTTTE